MVSDRNTKYTIRISLLENLAVLQLMKLVATLPVTTAANERFFLTLGYVKGYLRSMMRNDRLSNLIIMAIEKRGGKKTEFG